MYVSAYVCVVCVRTLRAYMYASGRTLVYMQVCELENKRGSVRESGSEGTEEVSRCWSTRRWCFMRV